MQMTSEGATYAADESDPIKGDITMKKTVKILAVALVILSLAALLVACKPSGKYVSVDDESFTLEFVKDKIYFTYEGEEGTVTKEGTFAIDGNRITITVGDSVQTTSYVRDGDTITIGGEKFTKK